VSTKHVVTAAHCSLTKLEYVGLGAHNVEDQSEIVFVKIRRFRVHPGNKVNMLI
jgi:hypothetical protein